MFWPSRHLPIFSVHYLRIYLIFRVKIEVFQVKTLHRLLQLLLRLQKNWVILTQEYYGTGKFQHWDILAPWTFQQVSCQHVRCRKDPKSAKYHMPQPFRYNYTQSNYIEVVQGGVSSRAIHN